MYIYYLLFFFSSIFIKYAPREIYVKVLDCISIEWGKDFKYYKHNGETPFSEYIVLLKLYFLKYRINRYSFFPKFDIYFKS
jgi:hypothetical protein